MEDIIDKIMTMLVRGFISFIISGYRRSDSTVKRWYTDRSGRWGPGLYLNLWPNCSLFQDPFPCSERLEQARPRRDQNHYTWPNDKPPSLKRSFWRAKRQSAGCKLDFKPAT